MTDPSRRRCALYQHSVVFVNAKREARFYPRCCWAWFDHSDRILVNQAKSVRLVLCREFFPSVFYCFGAGEGTGGASEAKEIAPERVIFQEGVVEELEVNEDGLSDG